MDKRIGRGKRLGAIVATTALSLSLLVPGSVLAYGGIDVDAGPINLQRDCGVAEGFLVGDAQGQCSYNIAQPSGSQDASAKSIEGNGALTLQGNAQKQINVLEPDASVTNVAIIGGSPSHGGPSPASFDGGNGFGGGGISPEAVVVVGSGDVGVSGHDADIDMEHSSQYASAAPHGDVIVSNFTGGVMNMSHGDNVAVSNAGASNDVSSDLGGFAKVDADNASIGGDGGTYTGNTGGDGPYVSSFGVDGGFGGSNVNVALGLSGALGGFGGLAGSSASQGIGTPSDRVEVSSCGNSFLGCGGGWFGVLGSRNGEAESEAEAVGGDGTAGFGAQANPTQNAGAGGDAWFTITGDGGAASGTNNAFGGAGTLLNTNSISGNPTATGTAIGGTAGTAFAGNQQEANTGSNVTAVDMSGGIAGNAMSAAVTQSDAVTGWSGGVSNSGSPSVCAGIEVNQGSNPTVSLTNTPAQSGSNTSTLTQDATSGAQTVSPFQSVSTGAQTAGNLGAQDAFKAFKSGNTDNSSFSVDNSNQGNLTNNGEIEVSLGGSDKYHR